METMTRVTMDAALAGKVVRAMAQTALFKGLDEKLLEQIARAGELLRCAEGLIVVEEGGPSDAFFVVLSGELAVLARHERRDEQVELARLTVSDSFGELGLLLDLPRTATVRVSRPALLLKLRTPVFDALFDQISGFGRSICRALAEKLYLTNKQVLRAPVRLEEKPTDDSLLDLLPLGFVQRHRILPLAQADGILSLGFVDPPTPTTLGAVQQFTRGLEIRTVRLSPDDFDRVLRERTGLKEWQAPAAGPTPAHSPAAPAPATPAGASGAHPRLDALLRRVLAEGASDLHLSGGQRPRWRIDGAMKELADTAPLGPEEVYELLRPAMLPAHTAEFEASNDSDFSIALPGEARFRVNLFRDAGGIGAVLRVIPAKILKMDQLGLPPVVGELLNNPKGLVLVTGPTGSGKSTTLAAMIDRINERFQGHIITLEDPIEFVHRSRSCLLNQREIGSHTQSFAKALRAALREDPDIVLVGEMRDLETVSLALETASTGHLVFGTLHTTTAIGTIDRIVEIFPHEQQAMVRSVLADSLRGVVSQVLCRKTGGGRVGVYEVLVVSAAVSNLIREAKSHQILSLMQTGKAQGNQLLNEELAHLVNQGIVAGEEAMSKTIDKKDLARRLPPT